MMFLERNKVTAEGKDVSVVNSFSQIVSSGGCHLYHPPQAVTTPGYLNGVVACFSAVTVSQGKCHAPSIFILFTTRQDWEGVLSKCFSLFIFG